MSSNAPPFDPLHPTPEEDADILAGYQDGYAGRPPSRESLAYAHGRRNGINDKAGIVDPEQRELTARLEVEIIGPDGKVHYRRPARHPDVAEARRTRGYSVRPIVGEKSAC